MEGKQDLVIGKQVLDIKENRFYSKKTRNKKQDLDHPRNQGQLNKSFLASPNILCTPSRSVLGNSMKIGDGLKTVFCFLFF